MPQTPRSGSLRSRVDGGSRFLLFLLGALVVSPQPLGAQALWTVNGVPVCVRPTCAGFYPQMTQESGGDVMVAWDRNPTLSDQDIYAQRLLSVGVTDPAWDTRGTLMVGVTGDQWLRDMVPDGAGGAFVAWTDYRGASTAPDIYAQHVLSNGLIAPGWPANGLAICADSASQDYPSLLTDGAGGMFIFWADARTSAPGLYGQHLNGDGTRVAGWPAGGLAVHAVPGDGASSGSPAADGQGGCFVVFGYQRPGVGVELDAQRLTWSGQPSPGWPVNGKPFFLGGGDPTYITKLSIVPDALGGAYLGWQQTHDSFAFDDDIYALRILSDGSLAPGWPTGGLPVCVQPGYQSFGDVCADSTGDMLLAWYDSRNDQTQPAVVYMQRLQPDGSLAPGWQPNGNPASDLIGYQFNPQLAPDGHGGAFVVYQEAFNSHGYIQRVSSNGTIATGWPSIGLPLVDPAIPATEQRDMVIAPDGSGGAITVWTDYRNGIDNQLYAQRYSGDVITATLTSLQSFEALPEQVTLTWLRGDDAPLEVSVERTEASVGWSLLDRASFDGSGRLHYEDRSVVPGARYSYRLSWSDASGEHHTAETAVNVPRVVSLALEGLRPNPAVGEAFVAFTLPDAGAATVEVLDIGGRLMARQEVGSLGAGRHVVPMNAGGTLHPGAYWLRLTHGEQRLMAKGVVLR